GNGNETQVADPEYEFFRNHNRVFSEMTAFTGEPAGVVWNRAGEGEMLHGAMVSANFFSVLGVRPALGRGFLAEEDRKRGDAPVVVLSHALWHQRLGGDPAGLGRGGAGHGRGLGGV